MTAEYKDLLIRKEGAVDYLTINRPDRMNTLTPDTMDELDHYFGKLFWDHSVRIVVMQGAGPKAFCAGLDLKDHKGANSVGEGLRMQRRLSEIVVRMRRCQQPIIALIRGPACGGGFGMALAADIRIMGESARMNAAFIKLGVSACDVGVSYFLPRLVGVSIASELMLTGRFINAERSLRVGLCSEVGPDDKLEEMAQSYIDEMLAASPLGLRLTKDCLNHSVDASSLEAAIAMEDRNQILCVNSPDFEEGVQAFLQKRKPNYKEV
jgi:enoyl-CoA hydratase/carnithine racemase